MYLDNTPHNQISAACDDKVWRVDVGMAAHYGGTPEVLELTPDGIHTIRLDH